jgi:hypothetical protein
MPTEEGKLRDPEDGGNAVRLDPEQPRFGGETAAIGH